VSRSPGDGDGIVALHLVEEDIDASNNVFVCNQFKGAGRVICAAFESNPGCDKQHCIPPCCWWSDERLASDVL